MKAALSRFSPHDWLLAGLAGLLLAALGVMSSLQFESAVEFDEWPTAAPYMPTAETFQPFNDGRRAPGEAIVGINEVSWRRQTVSDCLPCNNDRAPMSVPASNTLASTAAPAPVYPPGYVAPALSSQSYSEDYRDDCPPRFPIARAVTRGALRIVTFPFRALRNRRCG